MTQESSTRGCDARSRQNPWKLGNIASTFRKNSDDDESAFVEGASMGYAWEILLTNIDHSL